uniref:TOD1/MUCI70 glycosyltransferase-like domain-containing protein n=1 Tax=Kalanchoe fedtschenkoi TaxID=63787 RepID=A0A7N0TMX3_KALFE
MAQYRQSGGTDRLGGHGNGSGSDSHSHVVGIRAPIKQSRPRRSTKPRPISIGPLTFIFSIALILIVFFAFCYIFKDVDTSQDDDPTSSADFLTNVTRDETSKLLKFGHGSTGQVRDSRDWDRDDRRRDRDYDEDASDHTSVDAVKRILTDKMRTVSKEQDEDKSTSYRGNARDPSHKKGVGLYNEAGRNELKIYEAEYEASLKNAGDLNKVVEMDSEEPDDIKSGKSYDSVLADEYDDGMAMESLDDNLEEYDNDEGKHSEKLSNLSGSHDHNDGEQSSSVGGTKSIFLGIDKDNEFTSTSEITKHTSPVKTSKIPVFDKRPDMKKKSKRRKLSGCDMKLLNSTAQLVEPLESKKFARFSLQYTAKEENPQGNMQWEPRFAGHQSLQERESSFLARDQTINCGFVKSPEGYPSTGFDIAEDDARYISTCHIAVVSCIFGNSDHLRTPTGHPFVKEKCLFYYVRGRNYYANTFCRRSRAKLRFYWIVEDCCCGKSTLYRYAKGGESTKVFSASTISFCEVLNLAR